MIKPDDTVVHRTRSAAAARLALKKTKALQKLEGEVVQLVSNNVVKSTSHVFKNNVIFRTGDSQYFKGVNGVPLVKEGDSMVWFGEEQNAMLYAGKYLKSPNATATSTSFKLKKSNLYFLKLSRKKRNISNAEEEEEYEIMNAALIRKIVNYLAMKNPQVEMYKERILNAYGVNFIDIIDNNYRTYTLRYSDYLSDRVFVESLMNDLILPVYNKLHPNQKVIGYFHDNVLTYDHDDDNEKQLFSIFNKECVIHKSFLKLPQNQTVHLTKSKKNDTVSHSLAGGRTKKTWYK